jgi:hypothetical protein
MIAKPTTEQILNDCAKELMTTVLPAVGDETVQVAIYMLDLVLRNAAVRSAHEIAWMHDEIAELAGFARSVADGRDGADDVSEALAGLDGQPVSLHLDDVVEAYRRASEAFSRAMEIAVAAGDDDQVRAGEAVLGQRVERESTVMCGWSPVGR